MTQQAKKILYVEDEPDIRTIAQLALEKIGGFTLAVCNSGQEALDVVADFNPDIILLDVMMPDMDGLETYAALRQLPGCATIPVVFMTARIQAHEIRQYRDFGAVEVISKPFSPMTLADQVKTILRQLHD
jgi:two-component system OmpR family response regulator